MKSNDSSAQRTTAGMLGDLLASTPGQRYAAKHLIAALHRDRSGVNQAVGWLTKAGALAQEVDPEDRRRNVVFMKQEQAEAWRADAGEAFAARGHFKLTVTPCVASAAAGTKEAAERRRQPLRFGVWNDGALAIEGLARTQLTLPAEGTGLLAATLSALPEGALQALLESPLRPSFSLHIAGRDYPLTSEQTQDLVTYIEELPAKTLRKASMAAAGADLPPPGSNHRVHRLETDDDQVPA